MLYITRALRKVKSHCATVTRWSHRCSLLSVWQVSSFILPATSVWKLLATNVRMYPSHAPSLFSELLDCYCTFAICLALFRSPIINNILFMSFLWFCLFGLSEKRCPHWLSRRRLNGLLSIITNQRTTAESSLGQLIDYWYIFSCNYSNALMTCLVINKKCFPQTFVTTKSKSQSKGKRQEENSEVLCPVCQVYSWYGFCPLCIKQVWQEKGVFSYRNPTCPHRLAPGRFGELDHVCHP